MPFANTRTFWMMLAGTLAGTILCAAEPKSTSPSVDYAVVVSESTSTNKGWKPVVEALLQKHAGERITFTTNVLAAREALAQLMPRYACFVVRPEECNRQFVTDVNRLTRQLDTDPYTDVIWGILTGYSPGEALRIANCSTPLVVRKGAGGTAIPLNVFEEGRWFDEGRKNHAVFKSKGGQATDTPVSDDTTRMLVDTFNAFQTDLFMTSGHATERDWQIGYAFKNGQFRCRDGILFGVDTKGAKHEIRSPNPKVYLPLGNCLMGHIDGNQAMALAFMGSGGVNQMLGYTVLTWYGYGGWGVRDYFLDQPGRFTFAEAFFCNQQALLHQLLTRFPAQAGAAFSDYDLHRNPRLIGQMAAKLGLDERIPSTRELLGLLWDRDTVAFYGDPAWEARLMPRDLVWSQTLSEQAGVYTFTLTANQENFAPINSGQHASKGRPPMVLFSKRLKNIQVIEGQERKPMITENFLLVGETGQLGKGQSLRIKFKAEVQ